jgi:hypothetical protein
MTFTNIEKCLSFSSTHAWLFVCQKSKQIKREKWYLPEEFDQLTSAEIHSVVFDTVKT